MMFYIFTYIINGLCTGLFYYLNEVINHDFPSWDPKFISSRVLGVVSVSNYCHPKIFYIILTSRGFLTSIIFLDNVKDMFVRILLYFKVQKQRSFFRNRDTVWYREVQPLLNTMIRRQLLDIFSRGVRKSIEKSGILDNNEKIFDAVDGMYRNIRTDDRYYTKDDNQVEIESSLSGDQERNGDGCGSEVS